jgi:hypothetical protein
LTLERAFLCQESTIQAVYDAHASLPRLACLALVSAGVIGIALLEGTA